MRRDRWPAHAEQGRSAQQLADADYTWLEEGVLDASEGTGPWIAGWSAGPSEHESVWRSLE